ncbi:MAG: quinone-dependent dihydroorotate dehydrogenase [Methylococcaceae bacterium]
MLYRLLRPALFRLDPEMAHDVTLKALKGLAHLGRFNPLKYPSLGGARTVMGLHFPNPVGLAAGLDKDGSCIQGLAALGFGFIEVGTVTPKPQPGNPKPRLFRLPEANAIINRMGFNNQGVDHLLHQIKIENYPGILGINIGKNKDTPLDCAIDDYLICLRKVYPVASYVTVNISSPNTPGLRTLQAGVYLDTLLKAIMAERDLLAKSHQSKVPIAIKIAPDLDMDDVEAIADSVIRHGVDAVIATNTTSERDGVSGLVHGDEPGGLSGHPVFAKSTKVLAQLAGALNDRLPIIAVGGILSADDARRKLDAGASLIQVYSGLIYRGPGLVRELVAGIR